ncbi:MAG: lytic murein transglycosylase [Thermoleophilaceae bacterium]
MALLAVVACGGTKAHVSSGSASPWLQVDAPLPKDAQTLADRLTQASRALDASIDGWADRSQGTPPEPVALEALYVQRVDRLLAQRPRLASQTLPLLPAALRRQTGDVVTALRDLFRLTPPTHRRTFKTGQAAPAGLLLGFYRAGQSRFRIGWNVLAAVNLVETDFNRIRSSSSAGAQGPMQFLPATWRAYGLGGDIDDPHDAILGAANYLHRNGAPGSYRRALYRYNPSSLYVDAVLRFARQIAAGPHGYYRFYGWQVFVRGPSGDRRITGPQI